MADMPSSPRPPSRPSPPSLSRSNSRDRRRTISPEPSPALPAQGARHLRPPPQGAALEDNYSRGDNAFTRSSWSGSRDFAASREEFSFDDSGDDTSQARGRSAEGNGRTSEPGDNMDDSSDDEPDVVDGTAQGEEEVDYYALLNLPRSASPNQIRSAYHHLSRQFHPDKQPPEKRALATEQFNMILVAYETLINPHKRIIYDEFGWDGLKEKTWQIGVRSMPPEEFKLWLQQKVRKQKMAELEDMVSSEGKITAKLDISGIWFAEQLKITDKEGNVRYVVVRLPPLVLSSFSAGHSFQIPLPSLGEFLLEPLPASFKEIFQGMEDQTPKEELNIPPPRLTLSASLAGTPTAAKGQARFRKGVPLYGENSIFGRATRMTALPSLSAAISHAFPALPPDRPASLASILAGHSVSTSVTMFPTPDVTTTVSRSFGQNAIAASAVFQSSPLENPPTTVCQLTRQLGTRHKFNIMANGKLMAWPTSPLDIFSSVRENTQVGLVSIGYTYLPMAAPFVNTPDEAEDNPRSYSSGSRKRSQRTETYGVSLAAGLGGYTLARFQWGRTFFVGTALGEGQRSGLKPPGSGVGIRLGVEVSTNILGQASWTIKANRKIFENTVVGLNISIGGATGTQGVVLGFSWSRLGQKLGFPVVVAPIVTQDVLLYASTLPFVVYATIELLYLRPRERQIRRRDVAKRKQQLKAKTLRRRKLAEDAIELMRSSVQRKMQREREEGGLVILEALYIPQEYGRKKGPRQVADVTIPLAAMVESQQLVLRRGIDKSHLVGFWDPAPGEEKILLVRYLFANVFHEVRVRDPHGLVIPMRSHAVSREV